MKFSWLLMFAILLGSTNIFASAPNTIDLSGVWRFQLDPMGIGKTPGSELYLSKLTENIYLPGSMDEGGKGIPNFVAHVDRLSRKFEYCGQAWYQREVVIPDSWSGKEVVLSLERCHWETTVYVDGELAGTDERLSTPNRFILTKQMTPGVHTMTICVDNRLKYPMDQWNHGTTEYTQTNWNGIVGKIELVAKPSFHIGKMDVYPDVSAKKVKVRVGLLSSGKPSEGELTLRVNERGGKEVCRAVLPVSVPDKGGDVEHELYMGKDIKLWDEFSPSLYDLEITLKTAAGEDTRSSSFGMRHVEQGNHYIRLNGRNIHLRGALDCCVFPLTGYPATDVEEWKRIMGTVKEYGMNHVRFHSWCPPEAAFEAADELGVYLQVELPMWIKDVGKYPARRDFFEDEMYAILDEYGNHPSFMLYCNGNECEGDFNVLEDLVKKGQAHDPRHLYSASTARTHVKADQFYTSHVASKELWNNPEWITVYEGNPSTDWDRSTESAIDVPVIAHETGQRCMYPNFNEMEKYTGVLVPRNFQVFKDRLAANGMLHKADDFFRATGAHTVLQYKEVNEALLRSNNSGGFQLLGLSDFPGQGSAFVGILDAFWESKGLVTPEKYRESCSPVVLLARFPKRTYLNNETIDVKFGVYQFGEKDIKKGNIYWNLVDDGNNTIVGGKLKHGMLAVGRVDSVGCVNIDLRSIEKAGKYTLKAEFNDGTKNEWDFWVYPGNLEMQSDYKYVTDWKEARERLMKGEKVLFVPDKTNGRKTKFASHFWNPIMFNWNPMIVGTWIDASHPAFKDFPTSYYADWQWWDILNYGSALDITDLRSLQPLIQSVDTYEVNRKLGISFECKVGNGRLFVLNVDAKKNIDDRIAMKQLLLSISNYINTDGFNPQTEIPVYKLDDVFFITTVKEKDKKSNVAVMQLLNQ